MSDWFDIQRVAAEVYAAIPTPDAGGIYNCNAAILVLDDGVLVVDSHGSPSGARELIRQIRSLTDKPVRYLARKVPD
jgi:hypothetical protein